MASDIWNIVLNVVAAFIYAGIVWLWQNRSKKPPPSSSAPTQNAPVEKTPVDRRAKNRAVAEAAAHRFVFYFVTFSVLYLSLTMPPLFKALFSKEPVLLNQARFIGDYVPAIPVGKDYLQLTFFVLAVLTYWPLLLVAEGCTSLAAPVVNAFTTVNRRVWSAITMLICLVLCIPIAGTSIWLFYPKSFSDSLLTVGVVIFLAFAVGQAQGPRR